MRHPVAGHFERPPYTDSTVRSVYHVREYDARRLAALSEPGAFHASLHTFLSHDWPQGIVAHGDKPSLLRAKPYFQQEVSACQWSVHSDRCLPGRVPAMRHRQVSSNHLRHLKTKAHQILLSPSNPQCVEPLSREGVGNERNFRSVEVYRVCFFRRALLQPHFLAWCCLGSPQRVLTCDAVHLEPFLQSWR